MIHWNDASIQIENLLSVIESYTKTPAVLMRKQSLSLVCGKLSNSQDVDEVFENDRSVILGRVFDKSQHFELSKEDFKRFKFLSKEQVLNKIWGKYVYINITEKKPSFEVIVDPTGQLPFFYYIFSNGDVLFASEIEILLKVLKQRLNYNWDYLCSYFVCGNSAAIQTPFRDVFELPPGCCLKITKYERSTEPFWNPIAHYQKKEIQAKDAVSVLQNTLRPWVAPYKNICVSLSGGLDSSALMYCLKDIVRADQTLKALNYFHSSIKSSNELVYARKVCEETNTELIELDVQDCLPFDVPSNKQLLCPNKPFPGLNSLKWGEIISEHIPTNGSSTFLSGHGSDHIFMRPPSKKSIADYILEKGLRGSKTQLTSVTQFYRSSFLPIIKENVLSLLAHALSRRLSKRHAQNIQDETPGWMLQPLLEKVSSDFVHPIYSSLPKNVLPGKYAQIDAFYEGIASIHMEMDVVNPAAYPFLYEPVVEFALSFPTYELFYKGYDRYPLRQSISSHFKTETVWRRDKSQTTGIIQLGVKKNLEFILELCLEGHFVKQGLVEKKSLRDTIMLIGNGAIDHMWPFMHLASAEIFLKMWDERKL